MGASYKVPVLGQCYRPNQKLTSLRVHDPYTRPAAAPFRTAEARGMCTVTNVTDQSRSILYICGNLNYMQ